MHHALLNSLPFLAEFRAIDLLPAAGIMMLTTGLLIAMRKRRRRQATEICSTPQEQLERNRQLRGVRGDLESLMVEIEQLSKRLATQLDAKTIAIETLLKQADERITQLKRLSAGNGHAEPAQPSSIESAPSAEARRSAPSLADQPGDPLSRSVYQLADQGLTPEAIAKRLSEHVGKIELILALRSA